MIRAMACCSLMCLAIQASADFRIKSTGSVGYGTYDVRTEAFSAAAAPTRIGEVLWENSNIEPYFLPIHDDYDTYPRDNELIIEWGDIADGTIVGGFRFNYFGATPGGASDSGKFEIAFYADENGFNSLDRVGLAVFRMTGLPGVELQPSGYYSGWFVTVDLEPADTFVISGRDLDNDGLADFGWHVWVPFNAWPHPYIMGPGWAWGGVGTEDWTDFFRAVSPAEHNVFHYAGTHLWRVPPADFYMALYGTWGSGCQAPGTSGGYCTADIAGTDCIVGLEDLARLLSNYGATAGKTHDDGDIEPLNGDGDVDLADLAVLLSQYGDECN